MTAPSDRDPAPTPASGSNGAAELEPTAGKDLVAGQAATIDEGPGAAAGDASLGRGEAGVGKPPAVEEAEEPPPAAS